MYIAHNVKQRKKHYLIYFNTNGAKKLSLGYQGKRKKIFKAFILEITVT